ncbi:MAG TPA: dihydrofolate reductase [Patescibacteria group bacterium]|nr:dihydrofolate reductase [Patescibacteria group bacterium]
MIAIVSAIAKNNVIGSKNDLPWHIPGDLKRFKELTWGKTVLMGRNTYLSILKRLGRPLPGRISVVISRNDGDKVPEGVLLYNNLDQALADFKQQDLFVIGGASIYQQLLPKADRLYLTHIDREYAGDVFFPFIDPALWKKVSEEPYPGFSFVVYDRK